MAEKIEVLKLHVDAEHTQTQDSVYKRDKIKRQFINTESTESGWSEFLSECGRELWSNLF